MQTATHTTYNDLSAPTKITDPDGRMQTFTYDPATNNLLIHTVGVGSPQASSSTYTYNTDGTLATVTDAPNNAATTATSGPTTYTGSINYSYGAFVLSHGSFTGQISGNGQTYNISGNINGVGFQAGYFSGTAPVSFTVASRVGVHWNCFAREGSKRVRASIVDLGSLNSISR